MEEEIKQFPEVTNIFEPIDLTIFTEEVKVEFQNLCSNINEIEKEEKALVISKNLFHKFFSIFSLKDLSENNISENIYYLERCPQQIKEYQIIFLFPSKIEYINIILRQIKKDQDDISEKQRNFSENKDQIISKSYYYFHVPKVDISVLNYINNDNSINLYSAYYKNYYDFDLSNFVLDYDLISLEDNQCFKELFLFKFSECVDNIANILIKIQEIFGKIKNRYILGEYSKIISELLDRKEKEDFITFDKNMINSGILACFLIDRNIDYITPMCSEFTYEAMLHNNFGLFFNKMKIDNNIAKVKKKELLHNNINKEISKEKDIVTLNLSHKDNLYQMIKGFNFDKLRFFLSRRLKYQEEQLKLINNNNKSEKHFDADKIQQEIVLFENINAERPLLKLHINLANHLLGITSQPKAKRRLQLEQTLLSGDKDCVEFLHEYYESEMVKKGDPYELMRLFCLENLIIGGIKGKYYDSFKNDFLLTYGEKFFFLFKNLEELKILNKDGKSKMYQTLLEKLNLINFNVDVNNPNDTSFVFGGFSPISIRLIEFILKKGFNYLLQKDIIKNIGCEYAFPSDELPVINPVADKNFVLLVFTGGITYSEIEAIRYMNKSKDFNKYKFLIITTNIIKAKSFLEEIQDDKIDSVNNEEDKNIFKKNIEIQIEDNEKNKIEEKNKNNDIKNIKAKEDNKKKDQ